MRDRIHDWWNWIGGRRDRRPWAILGKGPTFADRHRVDWSRYQTVGLNHVIREQDVNVAHCIDFEVIDAVPLERWLSAEMVVMPFRPHVRHRSSGASLYDLMRRSPTLEEIHESGKLAFYNLALGGKPSDCPKRRGRPVGVRYFSSEAAFNLIAGSGEKLFFTLGIDGGTSYAQEFSDLHPFENGRHSFDDQKAQLHQIASRNRLVVVPLIRPDVRRPAGFEDLAWLFQSEIANRLVARLDFEEAALLYRTVRNYCEDADSAATSVVEIGRRFAGSTLVMATAVHQAQSAVRFLSVDKAPLEHPQALECLKQFGNCELITADSREWQPPEKVGLAFVDGDHSQTGVRSDVETLWPSMPVGSIVIFHDLQIDGVAVVVNELTTAQRAVAVESAGSLHVLRKTA